MPRRLAAPRGTGRAPGEVSPLMRILALLNSAEDGHPARRAAALLQPWDGHTVETLYRVGSRARACLRFLHQARRLPSPDIVYVMDLGAANGVAALRIARQRGRKLVVDFGDAVAELSRQMGRSLVTCWLMGRIESAVLGSAAAISVRGAFHRKWLNERGYSNVHFVPDGLHLADVCCDERDAIRRELGLADSLVVGVLGTTNYRPRHRVCYGWDLVEALALIPNRYVKALVVGGGTGLAYLKARAREIGVADRLVFTGMAPPERMSAYVSAMDICVNTQTNNIVGHVRTTGKLSLYLACGKYVISTDVGTAHDVLPGIGSLLPYAKDAMRDDTYPLRLAEEINRLVRDPGRLAEIEAPAKAAAQQFDYAVLVQRVRRILEELAAE
jgi:glycosyltransferase involved in cell wall biosynthesis